MPSTHICHIWNLRSIIIGRRPGIHTSAMSIFLRNWEVHHRLSSVAFRHSNSRAEMGVKTIKRMMALLTLIHSNVRSYNIGTLQIETLAFPPLCVYLADQSGISSLFIRENISHIRRGERHWTTERKLSEIAT